MKYLNSIRNFSFIVLMLIVVGCNKDDSTNDFLKRNVEELSFDYTQESKEFTIRSTGEWSIEIPSEYSWIKAEPMSGKGDGVTYQKVTITCDRNSSDSREGLIYLNGAGQKDVPVKINQRDGLFEWSTLPNGSKIGLDGSLIVGQQTNLKIKIPYRKAGGDESFPVQLTISGKGATGISSTMTTLQLSETGDSYAYVPINGTPTTQGLVTIQVKVDNVDFGTIETIASQNVNLILHQFNKFLWGGDCVGNKEGVTSVKTVNAELSLADETIACAIGTNGANGAGITSTIRSANANLYRDIEMEGWLGVRNYMRPGYIQLGAASATATEFGSIITPGLDIPAGQTKDLLITFKAATYNTPYPSNIQVALYPKNVSGITISTLPQLSSKVVIPFDIPTQKWVDVQCVVRNATNASSVVIMLPEELNQGGTVQASRLFIDDIKVIY